MSDSNITNLSTFILLGIPDLKVDHVWISIPFCTMYVIALLGIFTILSVVNIEPNLHGSMNYFLCMLAATDLILYYNTTKYTNPSTFILLGIPGLEGKHVWISIPFCVLYTIAIFGNFTILFIVKVEPSLHEPIHSTILTNYMVANLGLAVALRSSTLIMPSVLLASQWSYCQTNIIPHSYCEHMAVVKLACADIGISSYYGLSVLFFVTGLDVFCIVLSYTQISRAIFSLPTKGTKRKTLGTCGSHLCAILAFYIPCVFSLLTHRFGHNVPQHFHVLVSNVYLLVPPMLNPLIYGARTKQIRDRLLHLLSSWTFSPEVPIGQSKAH
ncbi:olfactory receptor 52B2-like [Pelodiscus sinensis]|uniref:olfactory receptor 52B2-like n=1 Tax=Pelodiscus sinensis TaxID=13735 RepID=UPI003F6D240F